MNSKITVTTVTPRLSNRDSCPHCQKLRMLISGDKRRCLNCGAWLDEDRDIATFYVVARTLNTLLDHGFNGQNLVQEHVFACKHMVSQQRIEFLFPNSEMNIACSVRWFTLAEPVNYQYLNKVSRKVVDARQVPEVVRAAAAQLSTSNTYPGSLRLMEASVDADDYKGRKFIRMEQSYGNAGEQESLRLRVEFSWDTAPAN